MGPEFLFPVGILEILAIRLLGRMECWNSAILECWV
jgi:hypothetical protein